MATEPAIKRAVTFFDGQNLFHAAKECYGYNHPNYDPRALSESVCAEQGWNLVQVRFYTGIPEFSMDKDWNHFWNAKMAAMGRVGIKTFTRHLKYREDDIELADGTMVTVPTKQEKGIDVRIAIDVIRLALDDSYDVAVIFSQDQDLSEVADEIKAISQREDRWIKIASAYPTDPGNSNNRGIMKTSWIPIPRVQYDACIDPTDYRRRR